MMEKDKKNAQEEVNENNETESENHTSKDINEENISVNNEEYETDLEEDNGKTEEEKLKEDNGKTEEEKLKEDIILLKEEKIRVLAEMENLRKRFDREKIDSIKYGSVNFARDILSPSDNLERALSAINKEEDHSKSIKNLIEGLLMVKKELSNALEKNGITKIDTLDKKFDPNLHQAMMEVENDNLDEGVVVQEIQKGYLMHDRLLRPAMVGVSKKSKKELDTDPEKNSKSDEESKENDLKK